MKTSASLRKIICQGSSACVERQTHKLRLMSYEPKGDDKISVLRNLEVREFE